MKINKKKIKFKLKKKKKKFRRYGSNSISSKFALISVAKFYGRWRDAHAMTLALLTQLVTQI